MASPQGVVSVDLERLEVSLEGGTSASFALDPFARHCLMAGTDELGLLLGQLDTIAAYEKTIEVAP